MRLPCRLFACRASVRPQADLVVRAHGAGVHRLIMAALAAEAELVLGQFPGRACLRTGCGEHDEAAEESCRGDHFGARGGMPLGGLGKTPPRRTASTIYIYIKLFVVSLSGQMILRAIYTHSHV